MPFGPTAPTAEIPHPRFLKNGMIHLRRNLLWVDSLAGLVVGVLMLSLSNWLAGWYQLPRDLLILMGIANMAYGMFSFSLAVRTQRPKSLILLLIIANSVWAVLCIYWGICFSQSASIFGLVQLFGEAAFVGGLAYLEWHWLSALMGDAGS